MLCVGDEVSLTIHCYLPTTVDRGLSLPQVRLLTSASRSLRTAFPRPSIQERSESNDRIVRMLPQERTFLCVPPQLGLQEKKRLYKQPNHLAKAQAVTRQDAEDHDGCKALASVLSQVGDKWTILVVGVLSLGSSRFNALQRAVPGISHRMLTHTLRGLERDGLVKRTAFAEVPPRVEYTLTLLGRSLTGPLAGLAEWASANRFFIEESRSGFDKSHQKNTMPGTVRPESS